MKIKVNDVYRFRYNEKERKAGFDPYWCFDGQLIVKQRKNGELYLEDTYWWGSGENKIFTLKQALEQGELTFICNLDDVERIDKIHLDYYDDNDLFDLSRQHGHSKAYYKKKDAKRSIVKMEQVLKEKIKEAQSKVKWNNSQIKLYQEKLERLHNGDISFYI